MAWDMVELSDVARINPRKGTIEDSTSVSFIEMASLGEDGSVSPVAGIASEFKKGYTAFRKNDVLVAKITPCFQNKKIGLADISHEYGFGSTEFHVIRPDSARVDYQYLVHFLRQDVICMVGEMSMTGSGGQRRVPKTFIENLQIPLPPLEEQRRIATILDEAQDAVRAQQKMASFLHDLEAGVADKFLSGAKSTVRLEELGDLQGGLTLSKKRAENPIEVDYLRVGNVQRGELDLDVMKQIRCTEKEIERCALQKGDILLVEANANPYEVGRAAQVPELDHVTVYQNHLFRARPHDGVDSHYLEQAINGWDVRRQLIGLAKTTSGLNGFSISQARSLKIPVLDKQMQQELSAAVEQIRLARAQTASKLQLLQELYGSLSARAFAGELGGCVCSSA